MKRAMEFYFEAVLFSRELPSDLDALLTVYGSATRREERRRGEAKEAINRAWETDTLKLEPKKDFDEARTFLGECAIKKQLKATHWFQSGRHVLTAIREYQDRRPKGTMTAKFALTGTKLIESLTQQKSGDDDFCYAIPRWLLEKVVAWRKQQDVERASLRAKKGAETKKAARLKNRQEKC